MALLCWEERKGEFQHNEKVLGYPVMFYRISNYYRIIVLNDLELYNSPLTQGVESLKKTFFSHFNLEKRMDDL